MFDSLDDLPDDTLSSGMLWEFKMLVTVQLNEGIAQHLARHSDPGLGWADVKRIVHEFGSTMEPMHPGISDPALSSYFTVTVRDAETAKRVVQALRSVDAVESAYVKPSGSAPR